MNLSKNPSTRIHNKKKDITTTAKLTKSVAQMVKTGFFGGKVLEVNNNTIF